MLLCLICLVSFCWPLPFKCQTDWVDWRVHWRCQWTLCKVDISVCLWQTLSITIKYWLTVCVCVLYTHRKSIADSGGQTQGGVRDSERGARNDCLRHWWTTWWDSETVLNKIPISFVGQAASLFFHFVMKEMEPTTEECAFTINALGVKTPLSTCLLGAA